MIVHRSLKSKQKGNPVNPQCFCQAMQTFASFRSCCWCDASGYMPCNPLFFWEAVESFRRILLSEFIFRDAWITIQDNGTTCYGNKCRSAICWESVLPRKRLQCGAVSGVCVLALTRQFSSNKTPTNEMFAKLLLPTIETRETLFKCCFPIHSWDARQKNHPIILKLHGGHIRIWTRDLLICSQPL